MNSTSRVLSVCEGGWRAQAAEGRGVRKDKAGDDNNEFL